MRIFLSHASEQRAAADRLAIALQSRGHEVFLDTEDDGPAVQAWFTVVSGASRDFEPRFGAALAAAPSPAGPCLAGELQLRHLPR